MRLRSSTMKIEKARCRSPARWTAFFPAEPTARLLSSTRISGSSAMRLKIAAGVTGRRRGFARKRELPHLLVAGIVVDLQHRLGVDVADHVLAFAVHAAQRHLAARHDGELVPAEAAGRWNSALGRDVDLTSPVAGADHEQIEQRIALLHEGLERLIALAAVGDAGNLHRMGELALTDQLVKGIELLQRALERQLHKLLVGLRVDLVQ